MRKYKNGNMNLTLLGVYGDYSVFRRTHSMGCDYIVGWLADFDGDYVSWEQGFYDFKEEDKAKLFAIHRAS